MLKNIILAVSLAVNALAVSVFLNPATSPGPKMTCAEATSEIRNKQATWAFASENDGSFFDTHQFLRASDYKLRNIHLTDGSTVFVYTANIYPSTCGWLRPGIDGSIVRVKTDLTTEPRIVDVY